MRAVKTVSEGARKKRKPTTVAKCLQESINEQNMVRMLKLAG